MQSQAFDLGSVRKNAVVTVLLQATANVRLMTQKNFQAYKSRKFYRMLGGVAIAPIFKITVPANGHWILVIDVDGLNAPLLRTRFYIED
jgi:aconitase B